MKFDQEEAKAEAKRILLSYGFWEKHKIEWFGATSAFLVYDLSISVGPFQFEHSNCEVAAGTNLAMPVDEAGKLMSAASLHQEGYELAKYVSAKLLAENQRLPETLSYFASLEIEGNWPHPKKHSQTAIPSTKNFLRDFCIVQMLRHFRTRFDIPPTQNIATGDKGTRGTFGASIVQDAFQELNNTYPDTRPSFPLTAVSAQRIWNDRSKVENAIAVAGRQLALLPSSLGNVQNPFAQDAKNCP
ncbi:hypothetical protein QEZ52_18375 [Aliisedimentitalea scapharcae]|uniref:Uncharacterized protein n=1 Tax=Aliisedimentitalea scapharcae TaxID=1524259 RepID=A0ABZ2XR22_9RHOB